MKGSGLEGPLSGREEGERMASSTSGGVLADDGGSKGEGWERVRSGSKFRNSLQSELKEGRTGCSRSSCVISNKAVKASSDTATVAEGTS